MELLIVALSIPTVFAYICRLSMLKVGVNSTAIIVMHVAFAMASGWAGYHGFTGQVTLQDIVSLIGAAAWIVVSYGTWKEGVPQHFTKPEALSELDWPKVHGGKK